jgi:thiamine-phosphate pyrophosphorylase
MAAANKFNFSEKPLIYLITDGTTTAENYSENKTKILNLINIAVETKISLIQIREKQLSARMLFEIASDAVKITKHSSTKLLINDRSDIALAANADGVHLTSKSLSAAIIKRNYPENFIVGVSTHTLEKAVNARLEGADFVTFSPVNYAPHKGKPQGIEKLKEVCEHLNPFPVIALGGIDATNFAEVLKAGASGFAAIRFLNDERNLRKLNQEFNNKSIIKSQ